MNDGCLSHPWSASAMRSLNDGLFFNSLDIQMNDMSCPLRDSADSVDVHQHDPSQNTQGNSYLLVQQDNHLSAPSTQGSQGMGVR